MNQSKTPCRAETLCRCLKISRDEVQEAVSVFSLETVEDVIRMTEAGSGCMGCRCKIKQLLAERAESGAKLEMA